MSIMTIGNVLLIGLIISMIHEPRNFWNAPLLLITLGFYVLGICMKSGIYAMAVGVLLTLTPLFFIMVAVFLIINGIIMVKKEGRSLANLLSLLTGLGMVLGGILTILGLYYFQDHYIIMTLFSLVLCLEFYIGCSFMALLIYSLIYTCLPKRINCDYIIVHGCGLIDGEKISPLLAGRVDKACKVFSRNKSSCKLALSGGKGKDEKISEAMAMKNYLLEKGFSEENMILEEQSTTTFENLRNVRNLFDVNGKKNRYIFVTNNYHVFRTGLFAKKLKMKAQGVGCTTAAYYWPSAFIREYIAIMFKYKWIFAVIILLWGLLIGLINF